MLVLHGGIVVNLGQVVNLIFRFDDVGVRIRQLFQQAADRPVGPVGNLQREQEAQREGQEKKGQNTADRRLKIKGLRAGRIKIKPACGGRYIIKIEEVLIFLDGPFGEIPVLGKQEGGLIRRSLRDCLGEDGGSLAVKDIERVGESRVVLVERKIQG